MPNLYITVSKGSNVVYIKTTEALLDVLYGCYKPYDCEIIASSEKEYNEGLENDLSFDVTSIKTIEEVLGDGDNIL